MDTPDRTLRIALTPGAYQDFFDEDWKQLLIRRTKETKLDDPVSDLIVSWDGIGHSFGLPFMIVRSVHKMRHRMYNHKDPLRVADKIADWIGNQIAQDQPSIAGSKIKDAAKRAAKKYRDQNPEKITRTFEETWAECLERPDFPRVLWSIQRLCYGSMHHSYENYVRHAVQIAKNNDKYEATGKAFWNDVASLVGEGTAFECLGAPTSDSETIADEVTLARLVRNSLAHNGGRLSKALKRQKVLYGDSFPFALDEQDRLQISPIDVRSLFQLLSHRVDVFTDAILQPGIL